MQINIPMSFSKTRSQQDSRQSRTHFDGMPVVNLDIARNVFVMKRSMASDFTGIDNSLFFKENTRMLSGDAREMLGNIIKAFS
ncbi:NAD(P)(+) transhydrogenase (Re/Si-specific) subunit beta [Zhongshania sp. BJYM1]|uniref:NAD(P)(+) transhydrogenase (Re/Si-specific) subunit beta n=1 Tax=Zhongshania aquatica TaxID=2965069 RepID=UPI0022B48A15|nr:NAD(P)(+) transhydrogenase (Re/Si-specific) subunit beta [Marortus sp. BJYM1]